MLSKRRPFDAGRNLVAGPPQSPCQRQCGETLEADGDVGARGAEHRRSRPYPEPHRDVVRPSGARGYRMHFERMGFASQLDRLEAKRAAGASEDELARAVPDEMLSGLGYAGPAAGAAAAFKKLSSGLDVGRTTAKAGGTAGWLAEFRIWNVAQSARD